MNPDGIGSSAVPGPRAPENGVAPGAVPRALIAGRWSAPVGALWWSALLGAMSWLAVPGAVRWVVTPVSVVAGAALGWASNPEESLSLEDEALVRRLGSRVTRLPLDAITTVAWEFVPYSPWELRVEAGQDIVVVPRTDQTKAVVRELLLRLEGGPRSVHVEGRAAAWLGWRIVPAQTPVGRERYRLSVSGGSVHRPEVCRAVLATLEGATVQAVADGQPIPREDEASWARLVLDAPWAVRVEIRGAGRDPLAVFDASSDVMTVSLTPAERTQLQLALPAAKLTPARSTRWIRAGRRVQRLLDSLAD